jgi:hypothetical protein
VRTIILDGDQLELFQQLYIQCILIFMEAPVHIFAKTRQISACGRIYTKTNDTSHVRVNKAAKNETTQQVRVEDDLMDHMSGTGEYAIAPQ